MDQYILYKIFLYLPNQDLFCINLLSSYLHFIYMDSSFQKKIYNRYHPTVFNIFDNYCSLCNIPSKYFVLNLPPFRCYHKSF